MACNLCQSILSFIKFNSDSVQTMFIPHITNRNQLWKICLTILLSTFFILYFLQPFGDVRHGFTLAGFLRVLSYSFTPAAIVYLSEAFLGNFFRSSNRISQTYYGHVLWYLIVLTFVVIGIYFVRSSWIGWNDSGLNSLLVTLYRVVIVAIIPLSLIVLLINKTGRQENLILTSKDKNPELVKLDMKNLLYLQSEDNYTSIHFLQNGTYNKKLLRGSLSHFEKQVRTPIVRIHRSYLINLEKVSWVKMNSSGGFISLKGIDSSFKVSRKYSSHFESRWSQVH